jgi:hypothetical protein
MEYALLSRISKARECCLHQNHKQGFLILQVEINRSLAGPGIVKCGKFSIYPPPINQRFSSGTNQAAPMKVALFFREDWHYPDLLVGVVSVR